MQFSDEQMAIIEAPLDEKTIVMASAASGKTATLTERIKYVISHGIDPAKVVVLTFTNNAAAEMRDRLGAHYYPGMFMGTIHSYANFLLTSRGFNTAMIRDDEDFDRLFEMIEENPEVVRPVDYLLCDESQDLNKEQFLFISEVIDPLASLIVGDIRQCQPKGTKILLRNNIEKNIEDILPGDSIVYYEPEKGRACSLGNKAYNSINKTVKKIEKSYTNDLITIVTEDNKISQYTPNHRTYVKLNNDLDKYAVYLMCDDNYNFRIGMIAIRGTECSVAWRVKMKNEGCSKIWIVKICNTRKEARVEEARMSYQYGIPQICWQTDKVSWTNEDIQYIYSKINTKERAKKCLEDNGLFLEYPLLDLNIEWSKNNHFAGNASIQIFAANIFPEYMDALCYDGFMKTNHSNKYFSTIIHVEKEKTESRVEVYSLQVEGGNYVADGIITHNSIYGFRGAEPKMLLRLMSKPEYTVRELTQNYRNGKKIIDFSNKFIEKMKNVPKTFVKGMRGEQGKVQLITQFDILNTIKKDPEWGHWAILCRTNKKVDQIMGLLVRQGIPCITFRQAQGSLDDLKEKMNEDAVKVLTIHSSKGLEFDKVIVCDTFSKGQDNIRLNYVAVTRARDELYIVAKN